MKFFPSVFMKDSTEDRFLTVKTVGQRILATGFGWFGRKRTFRGFNMNHLEGFSFSESNRNLCAGMTTPRRHRFQMLSVGGLFLLLLGGLIGCGEKETPGFVSSAVLESDLWKISPTVAGNLLAVGFREGDSVTSGQAVAWIDSIPLRLKLEELQAHHGEIEAAIQARHADVNTLKATRAGVLREYERAKKLVQDGATTQQRVDDLETQSEVSLAQIQAAEVAIRSLSAQFRTLSAQENTLRDQIQRCRVISPVSGRVLVRYLNDGEAASPGRPILEAGKTDTLWAEFFITQPELSHYKLGEALRFRLDTGKEPVWVPATLTWISPEAEFTPKGVQTREARNELVFRARVRAANPNGLLKRGMPVEVWQK